MLGADFDSLKGLGLVHTVFSKEDLDNMVGNCAIGHTRYSTSGGKKAIAGYQAKILQILIESDVI